MDQELDPGYQAVDERATAAIAANVQHGPEACVQVPVVQWEGLCRIGRVQLTPDRPHATKQVFSLGMLKQA